MTNAFPEGPGVRSDAVAAVPEPERKGLSLTGIRDLAVHETATADFYQALADRTIIASLRPLFQKLAVEERGHAARIEEWLRSQSGVAG
jgi:hypothetical protein